MNKFSHFFPFALEKISSITMASVFFLFLAPVSIGWLLLLVVNSHFISLFFLPFPSPFLIDLLLFLPPCQLVPRGPCNNLYVL
jgi:hypothetical protein